MRRASSNHRPGGNPTTALPGRCRTGDCRTLARVKDSPVRPYSRHRFMLMLARAYPEIGAAVRQWLDMHLNEEAAEAERLLRDVQSYLTRRDG